MKIGIASDHRGFEKKEKIIKYFLKKKIDFIDFGTNSLEVVDYTDYAYPLCKGIINKEVDLGILICGTGIGMSIFANKMKGIMCAKVSSSEEAKLAREHNHANIISISSKMIMWEVKDVIDTFISSTPIESDRYLNRINKIKDIEKKKVYK